MEDQGAGAPPWKKVHVLRNPIRAYAWGSDTAIQDLLGLPSPSSEPMAELWMGAHPIAPSEIRIQGTWRSLAEVIAQTPEPFLGTGAAARFGGKLPFLFKVLAAGRPLSLQAHPNRGHAREGFARENQQGIPLSAPQRNYKDDNHKPELLAALSPFWALSGFREPQEIHARLACLALPELAPLLRDFGARLDAVGLRRFFRGLMSLDSGVRERIAEQAGRFAAARAGEEPGLAWMARLHEAYPGDVGVLSPLLLNLVRLEPGQAMLLGSGQLHAYLEGVATELMASSDNVLRGGLTRKHVDVPELIRILDFERTGSGVVEAEALADGELAFPSPAEEFRLSVVSVRPGRPHRSGADRDVEILLCLSGNAEILLEETGDRSDLKKGTSVFVPAAAGRYVLSGVATLHRVTVPVSLPAP